MLRTAFVLVLAAGCSHVHYQLEMSSPTPVAAKTGRCEFRVVNLPPAGDYEEIATLTPPYSYGDITAEAFKANVHDEVCRIGGDVVVTEVNGQGIYVRGTVLRARAAATL
jgi:hypothetical protein